MEEETDSTGRGSSACTTQPERPRAFCRTCGRRIAPPRRYTSAVGVVAASVLPMLLLLLLLPRLLHASISPLLAAHTLHSHPSRPRPHLRPSHRSHRQIQCRGSVASPPESRAQTTTWKTTTATQPGHDGRCARSRRRPKLHRETLSALRGSEKVYTFKRDTLAYHPEPGVQHGAAAQEAVPDRSAGNWPAMLENDILRFESLHGLLVAVAS